MIDPHVHLRDWRQSDKETVKHGLAVAYKAGITRLFDMPNTDPPVTTKAVALSRLALAGGGEVAYHIYMGLTSSERQIRDAVETYSELFPKVVGLKMFASHSTGNMGIIAEEEQRKVFKTLREADYKGVLVVHAEKEAFIQSERFEKGKFETHSDARGAKAEIESVKDMLEFSEGFEGHLHIAHISTKGAIDLVKRAKAEGRNVSAGATPHHALFSRKDAKDYSLYLKMNPPLREEQDRRAVFEGLLDGTIDNAESDHAPHTLKDKENGASGIPGFEGMLVLLGELRKAGAPEARLKEIFGLSVLRQFSLPMEDIFLPEDIEERRASIKNEYPFNSYKNI